MMNIIFMVVAEKLSRTKTVLTFYKSIYIIYSLRSGF